MRLKKLWITIGLICCTLLCGVACKEDRVAQRIDLKGYSAETPLEVYIGKFSYNYTVTVTYSNGDTEEIPLTEDMLSETDKLKFYQEGESEIMITYEDISIPVAIKVSRNVFPESVQLNNLTKTYDGTIYTVEVEGEIPGGTKILYPQGNTFQNAGTYDMTAILQCDGYVTKTLSAQIVIEKATYDISNAQLYDETVVYNKESHGLIVKGKAVENSKGGVVYESATLPDGVSVGYTITKVKDGKGNSIADALQQVIEGNKAIDAGTYKLCAQFKGDEVNYNPIPDSVAYLTIERAEYNLSKVEFTDLTVTYSGAKHTLSISNTNVIPLDVQVDYTIVQLKDGHGDEVADTAKTGNAAINAGVYSVEAHFTILGKNAENYTTSLATKTAKLTILPASYDGELKDFYLNSQWFEWEANKTYKIAFDGELPQGVSPTFVLTSESGEVIEGEMTVLTKIENVGDKAIVKTIYEYSFTVETTGEYACVVTFTHNNQNYENITIKLEAWVIFTSEV